MKQVEPGKSDIYTFIDCDHRVEEIVPNTSYAVAGIIGVTTEPGLLDWSKCELCGGCCESIRTGYAIKPPRCPLGFG